VSSRTQPGLYRETLSRKTKKKKKRFYTLKKEKRKTILDGEGG
jgi:hypothetical protein